MGSTDDTVEVYQLRIWILLGLWNSFSQEVLDDNRRITPNQEVRRSVQSV